MSVYWRPIPVLGPTAAGEARRIAGGWTFATHVERIERGVARQVLRADQVPGGVARRLFGPRPSIAGVTMDQPRIMGILNVTPDSFSDGGEHDQPHTALIHAREMLSHGVDFIDVGGESTRPGAPEVDEKTETERTRPVIAALVAETDVPVSIDTRKARVAQAAMNAGARVLNDVSALGFDASMATVAAETGAPICLMHAQGTPETMQNDPRYEDVLLDVYDYLSRRIDIAQAAGIPRDHIVVDPGLGFGKTLEHNLALLQGLSLFHALGCPILVGASRKRFIGTLTGTEKAGDRVQGSVAVALAAIAQGVQIIRVHDTLPTRQGLTLWKAATGQ